jgi:hypothetical protein
MHTRWLAALLLLLTTLGAAPRAEDAARRAALVERGRYIVLVGHCNNFLPPDRDPPRPYHQLPDLS